MPFSPAALGFLRGLKQNNAKPWFEAHRSEYEREVRDPMRALIEEMDLRLARFAPEIIGDPKRSMFRIYRDIRFSKDKSPYKAHAACWFNHRDADQRVGSEAEGGSAGFYFHLQPGSSFVGGGMWMPARPVLNKIRDAIAEDPKPFERVVRSPRLVRRFKGLSDEAVLKRTPRGFAEDHPAACWLKYQSFVTGRSLRDAQVTGPRLAQLLEADFETMLPLVRWLNGALGLKPAAAVNRMPGDQQRDNPGVLVFPPLLFSGSLVLGLLLHWLMPWHPVRDAQARVIGCLLVLLSLIIGVWGNRTMQKAGTNVNPNQPTIALVTDGPFRFSRNPLYLSLSGLYLGITLLVNALWPSLLFIPLMLVAHHGIVRREERYLEAKFGDAYRAYRARVRRWL
jgi:uncharacterized protein (TIGR02453 family)